METAPFGLFPKALKPCSRYGIMVKSKLLQRVCSQS
jgi:hypothetical protein